MDIIDKKVELRKQFFISNKTFNIKDRKIADRKLARKVNTWLLSHKNRNLKIMAYSSFPSEPPVLDFLRSKNIHIYLPETRGNRIIPRSIETDKPEKGYNLDYVIVPALFVTSKGDRLGRGGGFYDRFLHYFNRNLTLFIGYDWQMVEELPTEPWDKPVGRWITDRSSGLCLQRNGS
ncbi:MAG: 5-formyltetrahydrofolate cyclo-ligase [Leptospirales bacterium]